MQRTEGASGVLAATPDGHVFLGSAVVLAWLLGNEAGGLALQNGAAEALGRK